MIVLDTNVVSEVFKAAPERRVAAWMAAQRAHDIFLCAPVMAELHYGVVRLPPGRRRDDLAERYGRVRQMFQSKILAFNLQAAESFSEIIVGRERVGAPISPFDAQIAAIARTRGASVATRNVRDFENCGVTLIDPWAG